MSPVATLIIPCYNTPMYYLERILIGLWPYRNHIEVIIVDDSPRSINVTRAESCLYDSFKHFFVLRNDENLGISHSYRRGFMAASAPYSAILDHDDEVHLSPILEILSDSRGAVDFLYSDEQKFSIEKVESYHEPSFDLLSAAHYFYPHHISFFRTAWVQNILGDESVLALSSTTFDICLWYEYLRKLDCTSTVIHVAKPTYGWRVHQQITARTLDQKPHHGRERMALAQRFFSRYESGFLLNLHPNAGYAVIGEFGCNFDNFCDYVNMYYNIEEVHIGSSGFSTSPIAAVDCGSSSDMLRHIPFGFLRSAYLDNLWFPLAPETRIRLCRQNHLDGVPYVSSFSFAELREKDRFFKFIPRNHVRDKHFVDKFLLVGWNG